MRGRRWMNYREQIIKQQPLCVRCMAKGRVTAVQEIHHKDGDRTNNSPSNLEGLCKQCHSIITYKIRLIGVDGGPL